METTYLLVWRSTTLLHLPWQYPFSLTHVEGYNPNDRAVSFAQRQIEALTDVTSLELWKHPNTEKEFCLAYITRRRPQTEVIFNPIHFSGRDA